MSLVDADSRPYSEVRALFAAVLATTAEDLEVPACPRWDVHDLVAHQVHQLEGAIQGDFPLQDAIDALLAPDAAERASALARQEAWIAQGVRARRATPLLALINAWTQLDADAPSEVLAGLFPDITVHFFDLLGAAGATGYRDHAVVIPALTFWLQQSSVRFERATQQSLRLEVVDGRDERTVIGEGEAEVVVSGSAYELLRAITGRRSRRQAEALRWSRADEIAAMAFPAYGWRPEDLDE